MQADPSTSLNTQAAIDTITSTFVSVFGGLTYSASDYLISLTEQNLPDDWPIHDSLVGFLAAGGGRDGLHYVVGAILLFVMAFALFGKGKGHGEGRQRPKADRRTSKPRPGALLLAPRLLVLLLFFILRLKLKLLWLATLPVRHAAFKLHRRYAPVASGVAVWDINRYRLYLDETYPFGLAVGASGTGKTSFIDPFFDKRHAGIAIAFEKSATMTKYMAKVHAVKWTMDCAMGLNVLPGTPVQAIQQAVAAWPEAKGSTGTFSSIMQDAGIDIITDIDARGIPRTLGNLADGIMSYSRGNDPEWAKQNGDWKTIRLRWSAKLRYLDKCLGPATGTSFDLLTHVQNGGRFYAELNAFLYPKIVPMAGGVLANLLKYVVDSVDTTRLPDGHLRVLVDEIAALKEQAEVLDALSQAGRSRGLRMVAATQIPSTIRDMMAGNIHHWLFLGMGARADRDWAVKQLDEQITQDQLRFIKPRWWWFLPGRLQKLIRKQRTNGLLKLNGYLKSPDIDGLGYVRLGYPWWVWYPMGSVSMLVRAVVGTWFWLRGSRGQTEPPVPLGIPNVSSDPDLDYALADSGTVLPAGTLGLVIKDGGGQTGRTATGASAGASQTDEGETTDLEDAEEEELEAEVDEDLPAVARLPYAEWVVGNANGRKIWDRSYHAGDLRCCQTWEGGDNRALSNAVTGYGKISYHNGQRKVSESTHSFMLNLYLNWKRGHDLAEGWSWDHLCHDGQNKRCWHPGHIEAVSEQENSRRRAMRKRGEDISDRIKVSNIPIGENMADSCTCDYEVVYRAVARRKSALLASRSREPVTPGRRR